MIRKYSLPVLALAVGFMIGRVVFASTGERRRRCPCRQRQASRDEHHRGRESQPNNLPGIRGRNDRIVHAGRAANLGQGGKAAVTAGSSLARRMIGSAFWVWAVKPEIASEQPANHRFAFRPYLR